MVRQSDYYAEQSELLVGLISGVGVFIGILMALGAAFGALNTMYSSVSSRNVEIATLRALGFNGGPVVISVLLESLFLALVGGLIGGGLAMLAFDGYRASTLNFSSFSQVTFAFEVSPALLVIGMLTSAGIGLIGGLFPAMRAARQPLAAALRGQ